MVVPLQPVRAPEKSTAKLECQLSKPNKQVVWFKNGIEISPKDSHYSIVNEDCSYSITVYDCSLDDGAEYTLRYQEVETSATLTIDGMNFLLLSSLDFLSITQLLVLRCYPCYICIYV